MKVSKRQFSIFQKEVERWLSEFGLRNQWNVLISNEKMDGDVAGRCLWKYSAKIARIILNTELPDGDFDDSAIRRTAFHEVCELLLAEVTYLSKQRFDIMEAEIDRAAHAVIRNLEHVVFNQKKE